MTLLLPFSVLIQSLKLWTKHSAIAVPQQKAPLEHKSNACKNDYFSMPHCCNKVVFFDWVCWMLINETLGISGIFQITRAVEQWVHLTTLTLFYPSLDLKWFTTKQEQNKTKPKGKKKKIFKRKQKEAQVPQKADVITNLSSWRHFKNANYSSSSQRVQRADNCFLSIFIRANSPPQR